MDGLGHLLSLKVMRVSVSTLLYSITSKRITRLDC